MLLYRENITGVQFRDELLPNTTTAELVFCLEKCALFQICIFGNALEFKTVITVCLSYLLAQSWSKSFTNDL